jgi:hypothetical protein
MHFIGTNHGRLHETSGCLLEIARAPVGELFHRRKMFNRDVRANSRNMLKKLVGVVGRSRWRSPMKEKLRGPFGHIGLVRHARGRKVSVELDDR